MMFDSDYQLLKARVLGGFQRNSRKASDVSEKTKMFQTACDSRKTARFNRSEVAAAAPAPASEIPPEEEIQEPEGSETHPQGETDEEAA